MLSESESVPEKLMPWLEIASALAVGAAIVTGFVWIKSRRQQKLRAIRSQNKRLEDAQIAREWEELEKRFRGHEQK